MEVSLSLVAIILAAGKSTRMDMLPKAALPLAGSPMGSRVLEAVKTVEPQEIIVVVGHQADKVKEGFGGECTFVLQQPQLGTAHALLTCEKVLEGFLGDLLVVNADHPLISSDDLHRLIACHRQTQASASLLTWRRNSDSSHGRILRTEAGRVSKIVEVRDATPEQLALSEINLSMYC
ncbi:MAG: NTP transferase domain-containing protein, partial [Armatimonadetes bacterium]|nr:NTP transferase domain-containing protein [Armatimonadota bacterium]NIM23955.1 NTP transferase domain-containing protein [Armatimonadota bacterium]NIM67802.1 NTP transferase domain-containing protein [Armatimonadota bacterium]NIM76342.1 NTP transferase domain-containing protein [Armatimonadota bacterium]NIN06036.1 NTP transferase domain-containing protein [Armatimonadota bacterium]